MPLDFKRPKGAQLSARKTAQMKMAIKHSGASPSQIDEILQEFMPYMNEETAVEEVIDLVNTAKDLAKSLGNAVSLAEAIGAALQEMSDEAGLADDPESDQNVTAKARFSNAFGAFMLKKRYNGDPLNAANLLRGSYGQRQHASIGRDEGTVMRAAMTDALAARMTGARQVSGPARKYMGMTFAEMVATHVGHRGSLRTSGDRLNVVEMGLGSHSRSDFPAVFENALNKSLKASYQAAPPTYRAIAQDRPFRDFRPHPVVGVGDFPMLERVSEAGEIKYGTISESRESLALLAYAKAFRVTRQMLVDDDLGAIERILAERGRAVAAFEDKTFYSMMLTGANGDGPTLSQTSRQVFNTTDLSKAGTGGALSLATLSVAWAALRKRKSIDGNELELVPSILLVGPDQELLALQLVETITANESAKVNPFAGKLQVVVTAKITGNAWYLFADPAIAPCFVYGFLEGQEGPRMRMDEPFGQQGMAWSIELDFGVGAIDFRGGFKNAGA